MATTLNQPQAISFPFAENGDKNTIPVTNDVTTGAASQSVGFPPITSTPVAQGGIPPTRADFNGIFNLVTGQYYFLQNGGNFTFNQTVSDAIGGYPKGAMLTYTTDSNQSYQVISLIENNTYNFVNNPAYIDGEKWVKAFSDIPSLNTANDGDVLMVNEGEIEWSDNLIHKTDINTNSNLTTSGAVQAYGWYSSDVGYERYTLSILPQVGDMTYSIHNGVLEEDGELWRVEAVGSGEITLQGETFYRDTSYDKTATGNVSLDDVVSSQKAVKSYVDNNLTGAVSTIKTSNLTTNRALVSNSSGKVGISNVTSTELGYLSGATSNVQTQINAKAADSDVVHKTGAETIDGEKTFTKSQYFSMNNPGGIKLKRTDIQLNTTPSSTVYWGNTYVDKNNTIVASSIASMNSNGVRELRLGVREEDSTEGLLRIKTENHTFYVTAEKGSMTYNGSLSTAVSSTTSEIIPTKGWVNNPATSTNVVHRTGNETIAGKKTFTGITVAPTPASATDNSTKIATTAWVNSRITSIMDTYGIGSLVSSDTSATSVKSYTMANNSFVICTFRHSASGSGTVNISVGGVALPSIESHDYSEAQISLLVKKGSKLAITAISGINFGKVYIYKMS